MRFRTESLRTGQYLQAHLDKKAARSSSADNETIGNPLETFKEIQVETLDSLFFLWQTVPRINTVLTSADQRQRLTKTNTQLILEGKHPQLGQYKITITQAIVDRFTELRRHNFNADGSDRTWDLTDNNALLGMSSLGEILTQHRALVALANSNKPAEAARVIREPYISKKILLKHLLNINNLLNEKNHSSFTDYYAKLRVEPLSDNEFKITTLAERNETPQTNPTISELIVECNESGTAIRMVRLNPTTEPGVTVFYPSIFNHLTGEVLEAEIWKKIVALDSALEISTPTKNLEALEPEAEVEPSETHMRRQSCITLLKNFHNKYLGNGPTALTAHNILVTSLEKSFTLHSAQDRVVISVVLDNVGQEMITFTSNNVRIVSKLSELPPHLLELPIWEKLSAIVTNLQAQV